MPSSFFLDFPGRMASTKLLEIQGSLLEGGGQILRMSVGLSALTGRAVRIFDIRGGRAKPGLKAQHLNGMLLVKGLYDGSELQGAQMDSKEITFRPGPAASARRAHSADTKTAGATTLLAQVSVPCLLLGRAGATTELDLRGGTHADMAPPADFYRDVFIPNAARFGAAIRLTEVCRGYFPRGGGRIKLEVDSLPAGKALDAVELVDPGEVTEVAIEASVAGKLPVRVAQEMADAAKAAVGKALGGSVSVPTRVFKVSSANGNGSSVSLVARTSTGCVLGAGAAGSPKRPPAETGAAAAAELLRPLRARACVDDYTQDQLVVLMALAGGTSRVRCSSPLTLHTRTAIHIAEVVAGAKFQVREDEGGQTVVVECQGIGMAK